MGMLRKAGQALLDRDQQYANFVKGTRVDKDKPLKDRLVREDFRELTSGTSVREAFADESRSIEDQLMTAAVLGSNMASRYAMPIGGLTAAGVGLYDVTTSMMGGEQTSGTVMP